MKRTTLIISGSAILLLLLSGCVAETAEPIPEPEAPAALPEPTYGPEFEPQTCWFEVPEGVEVTCGYLTVPEDRARPLTLQNTLHGGPAFRNLL